MGIYRAGSLAKPVDIAGISAVMQPVVKEWFNAEIEMFDPNIAGGTFDRKANTKQRVIPPAIWTGPARIQAVRWPNVATAKQEAVSSRTVIFHIPLDSDLDPHLIVEGFRVRVLNGGMMPEFEHGLFVITSTTNTSFAWDRRIETIMDQGAVIV